ncbi:MAG: HAD family hydrolase [Dehalococcoidia bacterium]|nr:HAD family hydrolase [Dehalococcoidia bacterium]
MARTRALLLDLGDTLFRLDPMPADIEARVARVLAHSGADGLDAAALVGAIQERLAANTTLQELDIEHIARDLLRKFDAAPSLAPHVARTFHLADLFRFDAAPSLAATLAGFRDRGVKLIAVSNTSTSSRLLRAYLDAIGVLRLFDATVFSLELGWKKPHPAIYHAALEAAGVAPDEAIFVGDRVREDVGGPLAEGIPAVLSHQYRQEPVDGVSPLAVIRSLDELGSLLR